VSPPRVVVKASVAIFNVQKEDVPVGTEVWIDLDS
jgi:hypothetical protein